MNLISRDGALVVYSRRPYEFYRCQVIFHRKTPSRESRFLRDYKRPRDKWERDEKGLNTDIQIVRNKRVFFPFLHARTVMGVLINETEETVCHVVDMATFKFSTVPNLFYWNTFVHTILNLAIFNIPLHKTHIDFPR